jgi:small subunit ribosomal protein S9
MSAEQKVKTVRSGSDVLATGRRKTAVARVRLRNGSGTIKVNGRDLEAYFPAVKDRALVSGVLESVGRQSAVNIDIRVDGGGPTGQAGACRWESPALSNRSSRSSQNPSATAAC